ncbi:alpha/beta fold hydrolase, partial [Victivallis vadensis]|uniref:alpha/beta fold hydrolase n=1 Tax=Victivallis vadensis TaxID=172901 RepID=UPI003D057865
MIERRWLEQADENGVITRIAYFDNEAAGQPVLLIHGFAEFSCTWEPVLEYLPPDFRYIRLDVKGFGYSSKNDPDRLSLFDFTRSTADFIRSLDLKDLVLVGHSMGGAISSLILNYSDVRSRVDKLV